MSEIGPLRPGDPPRLGDYELKGRLGEGGQGVVYLGESEDGERAAIKLLHVRFTGEARSRSRFARELAAARRVEAFCTARVLAADLDGETPYIASELIDGPSLRRVVERDGPLTGEALDKLAIGTATALAAIHRAGIAHRDFKPDNVLLAADGPRVVDFGIAKIIDESGTITTRAVGTPAYMAPEQIAGEDVGCPADVFAWGSTMVFTATGKAPFGMDTIVATLNRVVNHEPDLSALPEDMRPVVAACLNKDQARRPSADEVLRRLLGHPPEEDEVSDEVLAEGVQAATADLTRPDGPAPAARRRWPVVVSGAAAVGLAAAFALVQLGPTFGDGVTPAPTRTPSAPASPTPVVSTGSDLLDKIRKTGRLRIGYRKGLPGIALGEPPEGFEIDVAERIAKELGVPGGGLKFVPVGHTERESALERNKVDLIIATFSVNRASAARVSFAGPYYLAHRDILVRAGAGISEPEDLRGRKVCIPFGSPAAAALRDRDIDFDAVALDAAGNSFDSSQCAAKVADGSADAMLGDDLLIAGFGARNRDLKIVGAKLTDERYGVALRQGDAVACRKINEIIAAMYRDKTIRQWLARHFGAVDFRYETKTPRQERCR
ncbi:transporter substrate-binding domain-containing protein [Planomonospora sp. ID67723]|uniref:serine/threonine-protein kinase n=1 Tax=Planomonospora sp. ID67723 TaxID=2738134 RepID=UPI0018C37E7D|nr:serine/threonine-protein kinase [Planomonospora sp. ID67723]MBG0830635.1 transporter substrate-binding domain-containing protein [Planomonospora sp. ID67723]